MEDNTTYIGNNGVKRRLSMMRDIVLQERSIGILTTLPALTIFLLLGVTPALFAVWAGFHSIPAFNPVWEWVGLQNYETILADEAFSNALKNGIVFTLGSIAVQLILGVGVALLVNEFDSRLFTAITLSLYIIPTIIVVFVFDWLVNPRFGIIQNLLITTGLLNKSVQIWSDGTAAMTVIILAGSYKFSIFITLMVLAKLKSIPTMYYEAATISGANTFQKFVDITWPQIRGVVALVVLLRGIFMFNKFDLIWLFSAGGPGDSTTTLPIYAYKITFNNLTYGRGSAVAVLMFLILSGGGIIYLTKFRPEQDVRGEV